MNWQTQLAQAVTDPAELIQLLELNTDLIAPAQQAAKLFPLRVPRGYIARMRKGDINDPLLRQVLPLGLEMQQTPGYSDDPLGEQAVNPVPGLLHKYQGRVLLTVVGACGINCRYCFRRHFPYEENNPGTQGWNQALAYIAGDASIHEVILSGGDPLVATDQHLDKLVQKLAAIPHIKTLRVHSRMPIVMPERVTDQMIDWLTGYRLRPVLVVHSSHPHELDHSVLTALLRLKQKGITLLNQSVLLRGVNDNLYTLVGLSEALFEGGVLPYYLHLHDKVRGTAHFDVDEATARALIEGMRLRLPGYLVPKLVREVAGEGAKVPA